MFFIPLPTQIIGLDLSTYSIKAVEIKKRTVKPSIQAIDNAKLPEGLITEGIIKDESKLAEIIKQLLEKGRPKFNSKYTVVSLPEEKTFIKLIDIKLPKKSTEDKEIDKIIKQELPRHIPVNIDEMQIDWQLMGPPNSQQALVAAVPLEVIKGVTESCSKAGLKIIAMEVEAQAIIRSLISEADDKKHKTKIIIDLGANKTNIIIFDRGTIQFNRDLNSLNGQKLTKEIAKAKGVDFKAAEKIKINYPHCKNGGRQQISKIIDKFVIELSNQIMQAIDFYAEHFNRDAGQAEIVLCGGGAKLPALAEKLSRQTKKTAYVGNPLVNLDEELPRKVDNLLSYSTAIGLALRNDFNF